LCELIARQLGLHFPPNRWGDLQRGLVGALEELGFADFARGVEWLLSVSLTKAQLDVLASHLTIGETYFFREKNTFEILAREILPRLIQAKRSGTKRLRIWSAACCTGEEPYSLAILLQRLMPDIKDWSITILATDINVRFLERAVAGVYSEWSFREEPPWLKEHYFERTEDRRYAILPAIKKQVTFAPLNLVDDAFPSLWAETNAMDLVLCRNVLMYFSPEQAEKVVSQLHRSLVDEGWLVVSPSETSQRLFSQFVTRSFPGVILYQKTRSGSSLEHASKRPLLSDSSVSASGIATSNSGPSQTVTHFEWDSSTATREDVHQAARYSEVVEALDADDETSTNPDPKLLTRALADQGKLAEALDWCNRWISQDKLDASAHYMRAVILQELGDAGNSRRAFQTAIYLNPGFVLAHFALGNLMRSHGKSAEARKHFVNAATLLEIHQPDEVLPESDGLTAGRLAEVIASLTELEVVS
jgi:chemotaxis protein methyltransferase CheR